MKKIVVAAAIVIAGAVLAHLHGVSQSYYPTVKVLTPEGVTYIAVQDATPERQACGAANRRFIAPLKELCKACQIVWARCERAITGITGNNETALLEGGASEGYLVLAPGLRLAISGPQQVAKMSCDYLAGDLAKRGVRTAACIYPKAASSTM
jgi:hypothetical protein